MQPSITGVERLKAKVRKLSAGQELSGGLSRRLVSPPPSPYLLVEPGDCR